MQNQDENVTMKNQKAVFLFAKLGNTAFFAPRVKCLPPRISCSFFVFHIFERHKFFKALHAFMIFYHGPGGGGLPALKPGFTNSHANPPNSL